jgi:formaldehyde-activating enzyme involved in methanogenesis
MLLKTLLVVLAVSSTGCAQSLPDAPDLTLCSVFAEALELDCVNSKSQKESVITIKQADKFICVSPRDYEKLERYNAELRKKIINCAVSK